ncbi:helix-turn-helix transcriptional regulator [Rhizobium johnstonii]|uniref:helix-turn-helix transcriptional regulator n=1 Tax=Rhizobium johnstonii TaxID=3019933 RepID=UPI003F95E099
MSHQIESAVSVTEFCNRYDIGRGTWYNMRIRGEAPDFFRIGRRVVIPVSAIKAWEAKRLQAAQ